MSEFEADFSAALELHKVGRFDEAERRYADLLAANPHCPSLYNLLGLAAYQRHRLKAAGSWMRRALSLAPGVADVWHNLSLIALAEGDGRTLYAAARASAIEPLDARRWLHLDDLAKVAGRGCRRAVALDPVARRAWRMLGERSLAQADAASALGALRREVSAAGGSDRLAVYALAAPPAPDTSPVAPVTLAMSDGVIAIAPYCGHFRDAIVTGDFLVVTPHDEALVDGLVPDRSDPLQLTHSVSAIGPRHIVMRQGKLRRVSRAMLLGGSRNYYHWLIDHLPRLALHSPEPNRLLIVNADLARFQRATLDHLGFGEERRIGVGVDEWIAAEDLVVPSLMTRTSLIHPAAIVWLRQRFLRTPDRHSPQRIYVSRGRAEKRRLLDEDRVVALLRRHDFHVVEMEGLDVVDQAALFAGAETIVAPHGAALSNLVFASGGSSVIEIDAEGSHRTFFAALAAINGLLYQRVVGKPSTPLALQDSDITLGEEGLRVLAKWL